MGGLKKGQVTAKRAYEMADSLMNLANRKKQAAYDQKYMGQGAVKNGKGDVQVLVNNFGGTLSGNDRLKIAEKFKKQASADSTKSVRLKANADKAMAAANAKLKAQAGRDKPLPSSDGILSTIKNWFE